MATGTLTGFLFAMGKHPPFERLQLSHVEHDQGQSLVGQQRSVRSKHFLPIATSLHRLQHSFKVTTDQPFARACRFGEAHLLKSDQSCIDVLFSLPASAFTKPPDYE